jgi:arginase
MNIQIIQIPYDSGHFKARQGLGPGHFIENGLVDRLKAGGHEVDVSTVTSSAAFPTEVAVAFELNGLLAGEVKEAKAAGRFPVVLSGNCNSGLGTMAGLHRPDLGVIWFDAHGEFNTPDTTTSGWLDGMPLTMATGRCWKAMLKTIPGFNPIPDQNIILMGTRDLDPAERGLLGESKINVIHTQGESMETNLEKLNQALKDLERRTSGVYVHIDMDVLDLGGGQANSLHPSGGIEPGDMMHYLDAIIKTCPVLACGVASYDPALDTNDFALKVGVELIDWIVRQVEIREEMSRL